MRGEGRWLKYAPSKHTIHPEDPHPFLALCQGVMITFSAELAAAFLKTS